MFLKSLNLAVSLAAFACTVQTAVGSHPDAESSHDANGFDRLALRDEPTPDGPTSDVADVRETPDSPTDSDVCPMPTIACENTGCVDLQTNSNHCGACETACLINQVCVAGECRLNCPAPDSACGVGAVMACHNLRMDPGHCGDCSKVCSAANGIAGCVAGECLIARCNADFADCDHNIANGCEDNLSSSVRHCGACDNACPVIANATTACVVGVCSTDCNAGFEALGGRCVVRGAFPRPVMPLSLGDVSLRRPTLRWILPPDMDGAVVELCADRGCSNVIETIRAVGHATRPAMPLPPRSVVFWRLRATVGVATAISYSPTWLFHVPARDNSGGIDTSSNPHLDINGDGLDDVVVGAPFAPRDGQLRTGAASVFCGTRAGVSIAPTRILVGVAENSWFGTELASAGEVNGDGFGDLAFGVARAAPGGRLNAGTVSVFHGSVSGISMAPTLTLEGIAANDWFGWSVAGVGDVNADGFADVVVGGPTSSPPGRELAGIVSVFHGSASGLPRAPTQTIEGMTRDGRFGRRVASAGDVNGDGFSDVVVGSYLGLPRHATDGAVWVYHGTIDGLSAVAVQVIEGFGQQPRLGGLLASAGDVNGDGFGDVAIGKTTAAGSVFVLHGSADGIPLAPLGELPGLVGEALFGDSVAAAGDVNGDGYGDLVVGAYGAGPLNSGSASVFHGSINGLAPMPARILEGQGWMAEFGRSVAGAGDIDGDGFDDLIIGAPRAPTPRVELGGTASVFRGSVTGTERVAAYTFEGDNAFGGFGSAVASVSDLSTRYRPRWVAMAPPRRRRLRDVRRPPAS